MDYAVADYKKYFDKHDDCAIASKNLRECSIIMFPGNLEKEAYSNAFLPAHCSAIDDLTCALNHELGHHIVPEGHAPGLQSHLGECAADAYALLRFIQIKGTTAAADDVFKYYPYSRASAMAAGNYNHYTAAVVQKIDRLRKEMDVSALSPQETVDLAGKIAREYRLPDQTIAHIYFALSPLKDDKEKHGLKSRTLKSPDKNLDYYKLINEIMRENKNDHDVWRACRLLLSQHMNVMHEKAAASPGFWRELISFIDTHEKESGVVLGLAEAMDVGKRRKLRPAGFKLKDL